MCYQARQDCWLCFAVQALPLLAHTRWIFRIRFKTFISPAAVVAATQELSSWDTLAKCSLHNSEWRKYFISQTHFEVSNILSVQMPKIPLKRLVTHCFLSYLLLPGSLHNDKSVKLKWWKEVKIDWIHLLSSFNRLQLGWTLTNLNSGCSIASSCSIAEKTRTISVMITGHRNVMCTALILAKIVLS